MASILLIDDMPAVRRAIAAVLKGAGHRVTEAGDGTEGLARAAETRFDLVVTDILMPETDGTTVVMQLAARPDRPRLLAISGGSGALSETDALRLASLKADATLAKPFENAELLAVVDRLLGTVRERA
jgi:two-component system chemotaxis response regulator CheY